MLGDALTNTILDQNHRPFLFGDVQFFHLRGWSEDSLCCCDLNERRECNHSKTVGDTKLREVVSMLEARAAIQRNLNMTEKQAGKSWGSGQMQILVLGMDWPHTTVHWEGQIRILCPVLGYSAKKVGWTLEWVQLRAIEMVRGWNV